MQNLDRRDFLKLLGIGAATAAAPVLSNKAFAKTQIPQNFYNIPMKGQARLLHITDVHGQLLPVYFREPNVNLGFGNTYGKAPHIVGNKLLKAMELEPNSPEEYAYTYLNFQENALKYGKTGGFAHIKTVLDLLRKEAGGKQNTLTLDSGDLWQGSGTSLWTRGKDMVEASNILGLDVLVGHWEFTYREDEVLSNVALFKGDFIGQNVQVKPDSLFGDSYPALVEKYDGRGLFDEDSGHAFQPYVIKEVQGHKIAIVGQAFPRTGNANPQEFFPDWSFGVRESEMIEMVEMIKETEKPDAIVLLSHNGMDVDLKMAANVPGLNAVLGGHTHDGMPKATKVTNCDGEICLVTNAGSNGKYVGCMDLEFGDNGKIKELHYNMLPIISDWIPEDKEMAAYLYQMRQTKYDENIVQSRRPDLFHSKELVGKTFDEILTEKLAKADRVLYRRGNFMGTFDQVICNALRWEYNADIALSAGVRWGTTVLEGDWITMEDIMSMTATTYSESYVSEMSGLEIKNMLEGVADNLFDPDPYLQSGGDMVRVGGLDYTIEPTAVFGKRISNLKLDDGRQIKDDKKYTVAGWATVNRTPEGRLIWDIVRDYILANKDKNEVLHLEKINHPELLGVKNNPGIMDYPGKILS